MKRYAHSIVLLVAWLLAGAGAHAAGLAVIVHASSNVEVMTREEVSHLFLGRIKTLPSGESAVVLDCLPQRDAFYRSLVGRGLPEINAYWARLRFAGRTQPPEQLPDGRAVLERVASEPGAIGYVDPILIDRRVRTVLKLDY